jgi:hypothetical protein
MLRWVLVLGSFVVVGLIIFVCLTQIGTISVSDEGGFTSITSSRTPMRRADQDQFRKVIDRFLRGDLYDMLWVSRTDNEYNGITLTLETGSPKLSIWFKTHGEEAKLKSFKSAMAPLGFALYENSNLFSGGEDEEYRTTSLNYTLPKSSDSIIKAANTALGHLQGNPAQSYFLKGYLLANEPGGRSGITFSLSEDPLREVLGDPKSNR